jgi:hypothetical protein
MTMTDVIVIVVVGRPHVGTVIVHHPRPNPHEDVIQRWSVYDYAGVIAVL